MLNVEVLCVGKVNAAYLAEGCSEYAKRAGGLASLKVTELPEEPIREKNASEAVIRRFWLPCKCVSFFSMFPLPFLLVYHTPGKNQSTIFPQPTRKNDKGLAYFALFV